MKFKWLRYSLIFIGIFVITLSLGSTLEAVTPTKWQTLSTANFMLFYPIGYENQAQETLSYLEKQRQDVIELTGNPMNYQIHLTLEDLGLQANGYANPVRNKLGIFTNEPSSQSRLSTYESWLRMVSVHELTHLGHMQNSSGLNSFITTWLGDLFSPNLHSPLWLIEGISVLSESQVSPYEGRLNGGYYDGVLAANAATGSLPSLAEITYSHNYFPSGQQYLYGAAFLRYLMEKYGQENLAQLFTTYGSNIWAPVFGDIFPILGLDRAAKKIYGKSMPVLYREWQDVEVQRSRDWQVDGIKYLAAEEGYISNLTAAQGNLYYFQKDRFSSAPFNYPVKYRLFQVNPNTGKREELLASIAANYGTMEITGDYIYFLLGDAESGYPNIYKRGYGVTPTLFRYDLSRGESEELFQAEIRDFIVQDGEIFFAQASKEEYGTDFYKYKDGRREYIGFIPELVSEMTSNSGEIIAVSKSQFSGWNLNRLDLDNMVVRPITTQANPERLVYVEEDNIYYTASYSGYEAIYQTDFQGEEVNRLTHLGYAENGVFLDGYLYFLAYHPRGMAIYRKDLSEDNPIQVTREIAKPKEKHDYMTEINLQARKENTMLANLSYLSRPAVRLPPFYFSGQDGLGSTSYQISLNQQGSFDISLSIKYFTPLQVSLSNYSLTEERETELRLNYPLYKSGLNGLTNVDFNFITDFTNYLPGFNFRLAYPDHRLKIRYLHQLSLNKFKLDGEYKYLHKEGSITFVGSRFSQLPPNQDIREFSAAGDSGTKISLNYLTKLQEVRQGWWNPNIFLGDIYGLVYLDYLDLDEEVISVGMELQFEVGAANWFHFAPRLGLAVSKAGYKPYFSFNFSF